MGDETPSERTVGRAMAHNRFWHDAPDPLNPEASQTPQETAELPYQPYYCHQYWFIDIRYLVKFEGKRVTIWIYEDQLNIEYKVMNCVSFLF